MQKMSLNGIWDFQFLEGEHSEEEYLNLSFSEMALVPGCFDADSEYFSRRGIGVYRRKFRAAGDSRIEFQGLLLRASVYVDRKKVGGTVHALHPFSVNLHFSEQEEEHELLVVVDSTYDERDSSLFHSFYDFYAYSGICRPVFLRSIPKKNILERVCITVTDLDAGEIEIRVVRSHPENQPQKAECFIDGIPMGSISLKGENFTAKFIVPNPRQWSPENPVLHTFRIQTEDDSIETAFGLRVIDWKNGILSLNGHPLKLVGYNRHDSHPNFGYAMPDSMVYADLCRIRRQGCNFIRGSHYEQSEFFLTACDRLGLLVWEEPLAWGNRESNVLDPQFCERQISQTAEMIRRDYNHPCILLWGFMNELDSHLESARPLIRRLVDTVHAEDPTRPATFATNKRKSDVCLDLVDVISLNLYPGWADEPSPVSGLPSVEPTLQEMSDFISGSSLCHKPYIISEIGASAIRGDCSGVRWSEEYQAELIEIAVLHALRNPRCSGISLWQFCDTKTYIQGRARARPRGFNDKGLLDEYRRPKLAWRKMTEIMRKFQEEKRSKEQP